MFREGLLGGEFWFSAGHNVQVRRVATFEGRKESGEGHLGRTGVTGRSTCWLECPLSVCGLVIF